MKTAIRQALRLLFALQVIKCLEHLCRSAIKHLTFQFVCAARVPQRRASPLCDLCAWALFCASVLVLHDAMPPDGRRPAEFRPFRRARALNILKRVATR